MLIGTSKYCDDEGRLPDLPQVGQGLRDLAAALADPAYGLLSEASCEVIEDERDLGLIGRKLRAAAQQAEDLLLVYFSGHGLIDPVSHELYLALPDSEWADPTFNSLKYDDLRKTVAHQRAKTKVIILDCCFAGRAVTEAQAGPAEVLGQIEVRGTYVLAAAHRDKVALIVPGEEHTAFTGRLLGLLHEGLPDGPEFLTIDDLYQALLVRMKADALSEPQKRATGTSDLLPLSRNRAYAATVLAELQNRAVAAIEEGWRLGNWKNTIALLREVLSGAERILDPDDKDVLCWRVLHAHAVGGAGDSREAAALLQAMLPEVTRIFGPDDPTTLESRQYLAVNLGEAGYRDQAVAILRVLLPDRRRVCGNNDDDTLRTVHMLARNLAAMGETDEAIALLRELVPVRERVLGPDHPHTARTRRDLAALADLLGRPWARPVDLPPDPESPTWRDSPMRQSGFLP